MEAHATGFGSSDVVRAALVEREEQLRAANADVNRLSMPSVDPELLERDLLRRLDDWRGLFSRHVPQARQILRKLLPEPLRMTPIGQRVSGYFEFEGDAALGRLLTGSTGHPTSVASPPGLAPDAVLRTLQPVFEGEARRRAA